MQSWIAVDLDGTLAQYDRWRGPDHIGEPVPRMLKRVQDWVQRGCTVKIFTARVGRPDPERSQAINLIQDWLEKHGLPRLEVTNAKDYGMVECWDDRAVQVIPNTGLRADGRHELASI